MDGNSVLRRDPSQLARAPRSHALRDRLVRLSNALLIWIERARERRALATLDDHMLRDIGSDRGRIHAELSKPFWRP